MTRLERAKKKYTAAIDEVRAATRAAFPIGTHVIVELGGRRIHGEVTEYGPDWSSVSADEVYIINVETTKRRHFSAMYADVTVYR